MVSGRDQPRVKLLAGAVAAALALMAGSAGAQVFDPNSPAVRDAYIGPVTSDKIQAALSAFNKTSDVTLSLFGNFSFSLTVVGSFGFDRFTISEPPLVAQTLIFAGTDADLGAPGAPVDLTLKSLQASAGFMTARDFTVASSTINTNAFQLTLNGIVTANGPLDKQGSGILVLNGVNVWNG